MYRFFYFLMIILLPVIFSWWLFVPMAILFVYLAKVPYELVVAGAILDAVYYFGESFWWQNQLTLFSLILIFLALFFRNKIHWQSVI